MLGIDFRGGALGTSILLSSLGLTGGISEANSSTVEPPNQAAAVKVEPNGILDQSTHVDRLSGPLQHAKAPIYDGPVAWGGADVSVLLGTLAGITGALGSGMLTHVVTQDTKKTLAGMTIGGLVLGFAVGGSVYQPTEVISFETRIQSVERTFDPIGKTMNNFSQHLRIPETDLLLFAEGLSSPFVEGQKVNVNFFMEDRLIMDRKID
jgi:hypothetical protein